MNYLIPDLNSGALIINPTIVINGTVGANIQDGVSVGTYFVDLKLTNSGVSCGLTLVCDNPPPNWTVMEDIHAWAVTNLDAQYGQV